MNKNRQQLKTGLRAILGGGLREELAASEASETTVVVVKVPESEREPAKTIAISAEPLVVVEAAVKNKDAPEENAPEEPRAVVLFEETARKSRKKPAAPPPPEPRPNTSSAVRVGTLENPYVRKRDNLPTRKVGIVLPVALAERMQIHCVKARTRPNEFVARAIEALLDELQA
jgi:hypothetical protein